MFLLALLVSIPLSYWGLWCMQKCWLCMTLFMSFGSKHSWCGPFCTHVQAGNPLLTLWRCVSDSSFFRCWMSLSAYPWVKMVFSGGSAQLLGCLCLHRSDSHQKTHLGPETQLHQLFPEGGGLWCTMVLILLMRPNFTRLHPVAVQLMPLWQN